MPAKNLFNKVNEMKHDQMINLAFAMVLILGFFLGVTTQASAWTYLDPLKETAKPGPEPTPPPVTARPTHLLKQVREFPKRPISPQLERRKINPQATTTPPPPTKMPLRRKIVPQPTPPVVTTQIPQERRKIDTKKLPNPPVMQVPQQKPKIAKQPLPKISPPTGQVPAQRRPKIAKQPLPKVAPQVPKQLPLPKVFPRPGGITERGRRFSRVEQEQLQRKRYGVFNNLWQNWQIAQQQRRLELQRHRRNNYMRYQQEYWNRLMQDRLRLQNARYYDNLYYNYGYWRDGTYYYTSEYGAQMIQQAIHNGYEEGYREGRADRLDGWNFDPYNAYGYADGAYGYDSYYIEMDEYAYYFRQGFMRGYEDGYHERYNYGHYSDGRYMILDTVLRTIFSFVRLD